MDEAMLEAGKFDCVICIEDLKVGEIVVCLPYNYSFYEACIAEWLEYDTCPLCRGPIRTASETAIISQPHRRSGGAPSGLPSGLHVRTTRHGGRQIIGGGVNLSNVQVGSGSVQVAGIPA